MAWDWLISRYLKNLECAVEKVCLEMSVGRNMNIKGASGEVSEGNEKNVIKNWRKGKRCCILSDNLSELYPGG